MGEAPLVLASASPRRAELLRMLGIPYETLPVDVDESVLPDEGPEAHVERLARLKAGAAAERRPGAWTLGGDTVVTVDGEILGKPREPRDAVRMLLRLQGRGHQVLSGLALQDPDGRIRSGVGATEVRFRAFDRATAEAYVATREPMDKAGAYGIQGAGSALVEGITGDYFTVVGLPVPLLVRLLEEAGRPYRF